MDQLTIGMLGFIVFLVLSLLRVPIAYAMSIVGVGGMIVVYPIETAFKFIPTGIFTYTSNFTLSALPLFILMGTLAYYADLGKDAFDAAKAWFGRVPGGAGRCYGVFVGRFRRLLRFELVGRGGFFKNCSTRNVASKLQQKISAGCSGLGRLSGRADTAQYLDGVLWHPH